MAPGICLLSRGAVPRGAGAAARSVDRQIRWFSVVGGAAGAGTWGQVSKGTFRRSGAPEAMQWKVTEHVGNSHARNIRDPLRVLEQGPDRQRAPICCSGGLSSIRGASESRCSHDDAVPSEQQVLRCNRHRSSLEVMGLHEARFTVMPLAELGPGAGCPAPAGWPAPVARVWEHRRRRPWRC